MHSLLALLDTDDLQGFMALSIPILGVLIGPTIVFIIFRARRERERLWHETARLAIEKGQPLPPLPADLAGSDGVKTGDPARSHSLGFGDLRSGLVMVGIGVGLYFGLQGLPHQTLVAAYIVGGIGLARVISGIVSMLRTKDKPKE